MTRIWDSKEIIKEIDIVQNQLTVKIKQYMDAANYFATDKENQIALDNLNKIHDELFELEQKLNDLQKDYWFAQHLGLGCI